MATVGREPGGDNSITALLLQLGEGNREVEERLIPQIYGELRRLAGQYMRRERGNHTLQPTALVHEAYARLVQQPQVPWQSRAHFLPAPPGSCETSLSTMRGRSAQGSEEEFSIRSLSTRRFLRRKSD